MNDKDELRDLWKSQSLPQEVKGETMLELVEKQMQHFDRKITTRNLREYIGGALVAIIFLWIAFHSPTPLIRAGALLVVASGLWIIFYLRSYGDRPPDPSQNLADYQLALLERYDRQIRLLKSVKMWYLLPMYIGLMVMSFGLAKQHSAAFVWSDLLAPAIYTAVFAVIWWLNEVSAVKRLRNDRAKLLALTGQY